MQAQVLVLTGSVHLLVTASRLSGARDREPLLLGPPSLSPLGLTQLGRILEPQAPGKCCQGELCGGKAQGVKVRWL